MAAPRDTVAVAMAQLRIALVDDEAPVRAALGRVLRLADFEVLPYACGEDFLAALDGCVPDCAVLDVHMPGLTGIQVQRRLPAAHAQLPVVFITASEDPGVDRDALQAGGLRVLRKPFTSNDLLSSIATAMKTESKTAR